jgi:oxygen-dependent protoporphyrinogen oxidase
MKRVIVVGGGIAGLSTAWALRWREPGAQLIVLERGARTGGNVRTESVEGYTCEAGPDGFLDNAPDTLRLVRQIGLEKRLLPSLDAARKRYIFRNGRLHEVPLSPPAMLTSRLLSPLGKARLLCEPLARRRPDGDESIHDFAARHIGEEAASILVDSMVSGVFAGDARQLSLRACFPKMYEMESQYGSLVRALIAKRRERKHGRVSPELAPRAEADAPGAPAGRLTSFATGMGELIEALSDMLADTIRLNTRVLNVRRDPETRGWNVMTTAGHLEADAVILAGPATEAAESLRTFDQRLARELDDIPTAPVAVLALGYDAAAIPPLDGFGFLVPRSEGIRTLGALWETSIYPNRAPEGKALLRVIVGGARDCTAVSLTDDELLDTVGRDLATTMHLTAAPEFVRITRHPRGIPQYERGHLARLERLDALASSHRGLYFAGNSYRGVSMNSCISEADRIAEAVLADGSTAVRYPIAV